MKMTKEVVEALKSQDETKLYHSLYDIYDKDSVKAVEAFNQWKSQVKERDRNLIIRAEQRIYENEEAFNFMF